MNGTSDEPRVVRLTVPEVQYAMALATQRDACKPDRDSRLRPDYLGSAFTSPG